MHPKRGHGNGKGVPMKNNIASERTRIGMSQEGLGKALSVSCNTVSNWESERTPVPSDKLVAMAEKFGCTVDYLLNRCEERTARYLSN